MNPITGTPGLRDLPRTTFGDPFKVQSADIDTGAVTPRTVGLIVRNQSGSSIPAGSLVYISSWSAPQTNFPNGLALISLAAATTRYTGATYIAQTAIANNANGIVAQQMLLTGLNTNAATVGDPVYLDSAVPGGFVLTNPPGTGNYYQVVGRVVVKSATVGVVDLNLASGVPAAVGAQRFTYPLPTVGTAAGAYPQTIPMPFAGVLGGIFIEFSSALAQSDTNFVAFTLNNRGNGGGNTPILATAAGANSTKVTGGAAIAANTPLLLTQLTGPFSVLARDTLDLQMTVTGTLANTLPGGSLLVVLTAT